MKFLVVLAVAVACASADVSHVLKDDFSAGVLRNDYEISPEGSYQFGYETSNGIAAQAQGVLKNQNSEYPSLDVSGAFQYKSPEGQSIELSYIADEFGFKPVGSHLPEAPPTPEAILRALEYIAAHPPPVEGVLVKSQPKPAYG